MQLITHQNHIDKLPDSALKANILARFSQLSQETDIPPIIILVESNDEEFWGHNT